MKYRVSIGISVGDTVPLRGGKRFYVWAYRPDENSIGGVGVKLWFIFMRVCYGGKSK
jgi:hypothetical protein